MPKEEEVGLLFVAFVFIDFRLSLVLVGMISMQQ